MEPAFAQAARSFPSRSIHAGLYWGAGFLVLTGLVTLLLPNTVFSRETPIHWWDYPLWGASALLVGGFMAVRDAIRNAGIACSTTAGAGGLAAFLGFSCPVCNHVLVFLMGTGGALSFVEPYRLYIGLVGNAFLALALVLVWNIYHTRISPPDLNVPPIADPVDASLKPAFMGNR